MQQGWHRDAPGGAPPAGACDSRRMNGYPLTLRLDGRRVVVVGGGRVAARRVPALLAAGARVTVVAPAVDPALEGAGVQVVRRGYAPGDLEGSWLVHACTDDPAVNSAVAAEAEAAGVWCVRADDATASAAWVPAVGAVDDVQVAVTAGGDPRRAARLRVAVTTLLREGRLPLRRTRRPAGEPGRVALVGGGPGDPDLITVRGRRLLAGADVVVVDRLAPRELLAELDPDVEVVDAGKAAGSHRLRQEQINAVLVERARRGARVVRLKGGDPFLFGRGGEEALACARAGVPYEVVPGVTSAIGVPAAAGIPVTHRGTAQQLVIATGHLEPGHPDSGLDWAQVAGARGTLVLLMAVERLEQVVAALIRHGRPADTPVAVIQRGTTAAERTVTGDLGSIGGRVAAAGLGPPAVVVVGDVVRLRTALAPG